MKEKTFEEVLAETFGSVTGTASSPTEGSLRSEATAATTPVEQALVAAVTEAIKRVLSERGIR